MEGRLTDVYGITEDERYTSQAEFYGEGQYGDPSVILHNDLLYHNPYHDRELRPDTGHLRPDRLIQKPPVGFLSHRTRSSSESWWVCAQMVGLAALAALAVTLILLALSSVV